MNIVDYIILAILAYGLLAGMYKGMITSTLSLFGFAGAWFGAQAVYEKVANLALSNSTLMAVLNQYLEPETFFENHSQAVMSVAEVVKGSESAIQAAVNTIGEKFSFLADAFSLNIRTQAFANLGIDTLSDYFNQTLWVAVFNVAAFILSFVVIYFVISLLVNLLDRVIAFPILRGFDWLVGGVLGLLRASVVVVLILCILPSMFSLIDVQLTQELMNGSKLYSAASQFDLLRVTDWVRTLING